ncbi:hypothetical protein ES731_00025 [Psychroflexus gondwanensis]|jgi:hypothetical protein|uniref:hypothetical protein n=1 Tax=Psychroflexus gondwanensis TaxID=251 RepID=UPI0011BE6D81|nr:hypothetical protein [Psychroflexus gondwanensis]TXE21335.1 hypothetical protein ES731_00025 [Psychroflexus gondwanensis]
MKKQTFIFIFCLFTIITKSQTASVEESTSGIQTGFLGIWLHNERRLSNQFVLRGELGFDSSISGGTFYSRSIFLMTPVLTAEPRWYYNLNKRKAKSKSIEGNSGNFLSLKTSYHPDWFVISNEENIQVVSDISFIPTWGIKRNIGTHFTYETGIGFGYRYYFAKQSGFIANEGEIAINLHLRVGYRF